jgi:hypothetical protein
MQKDTLPKTDHGTTKNSKVIKASKETLYRAFTDGCLDGTWRNDWQSSQLRS